MIKKHFKRKINDGAMENYYKQGYVEKMITRDFNKQYLRDEDEVFREYFARLALIEKTKFPEVDRKADKNILIKNRDFKLYNVNTKSKEDMSIFIRSLCDWMTDYKKKSYLSQINRGCR